MADKELSEREIKRIIHDHKKKLYETAKRQRKLNQKKESK